MHRDLKLDNILIHFPEHDLLTKHDLRNMNLNEMTEAQYCVKIADLGYARELTK